MSTLTGIGKVEAHAKAVGGTTNDYVTVWTLDTRNANATFVLKNTGAADLDLRIVSKMYADGDIEYEELGTTTITAGSSIRYIEKEVIGYIFIQVKANVAGSHTSWMIEHLIER